MNKKILLPLLFFTLFSAVFASADTCTKEDVLNSLRKALYIYYTDPSKSTLTVEELIDLLAFYTSIQGVGEEVECTPTQNNLANKAFTLPDKIPSCTDGTKYGKCSSNKPMYCYAGRLVPRCRLCGCPEGQWCDPTYVDTSKGNQGQWGKCNLINITTNVTFNLALRIADCATLNTDCESGTLYEGVEIYGCALEGATVKLEALNNWNSYSAQLIVNSGEHSDVGDAPAGRSEWIVFKSIPVWTGTPNYNANEGFYRITVTKDGYTSKTGLIGIFGTTGADLYWYREFIGNYICLKATPTTCTPTEQLIVDFKSLSGTTTTNTYSGQVSISVVGTGQSSGIAYNDAFYVYTSYLNGQPITPIIQNPFLLYIDGKPVTNSTSAPSYNSQHNYKFTINVGTTPRKISFKIGDTYVPDNSGSFTIGICADAIGKCLDGTPYGQCSTTKPKYCDNGVLKDNCQTCGCSTGTCQTNGTCQTTCPIKYTITNCQELQNMKCDLSGNYILANDIDCSDTKNWNNGTGFYPIGDCYIPAGCPYAHSNIQFNGTFDGKGYVIKNLYSDSTNRGGNCFKQPGLFLTISDGAQIKNVGIVDADMKMPVAAYGGGILAYQILDKATITNSYTTGKITGNGLGHLGGLVGGCYSCHIVQSYSTATVTSLFSNTYSVGGLVGRLAGGSLGMGTPTITDSYATGNVSGYRKVGGLVGERVIGTITNSYSSGAVTANSEFGGLVGFQPNTYPSITSSSYWDTQTSGQNTSYGGTGKTTAEMKQKITFTGWDFTNTWGICEGSSYPWLKWEGRACGPSCGKEVQITTSTAIQTGPDIYGDKIVWYTEYGRNSDIYMYDLSTGQEKQITTNIANQNSQAIYGNKIVWEDWRSGKADIYMYDLSTGQEKQITTNTAYQWCPDIYGDKIVWYDDRNGNGFVGDVYMYDLSTGQETRITTNTTYQHCPAIYGDKIVWPDHKNGNWDTYMYDLSTGQEKQITTNIAEQGSPAIYGDKIVWSDNRSGNWDIYMYDLSTGQEKQITTNTAIQFMPAIYGDKIVWYDNRNGNYDIYMYDLTTGQEKQITTNTAHQYGADIYGDKIVWVDERNGNRDIYMTTIC